MATISNRLQLSDDDKLIQQNINKMLNSNQSVDTLFNENIVVLDAKEKAKNIFDNHKFDPNDPDSYNLNPIVMNMNREYDSHIRKYRKGYEILENLNNDLLYSSEKNEVKDDPYIAKINQLDNTSSLPFYVKYRLACEYIIEHSDLGLPFLLNFIYSGIFAKGYEYKYSILLYNKYVTNISSGNFFKNDDIASPQIYIKKDGSVGQKDQTVGQFNTGKDENGKTYKKDFEDTYSLASIKFYSIGLVLDPMELHENILLEDSTYRETILRKKFNELLENGDTEIFPYTLCNIESSLTNVQDSSKEGSQINDFEQGKYTSIELNSKRGLIYGHEVIGSMNNDDFLTFIYILIHGLNVANNKFGFIHYDLRLENILIKVPPGPLKTMCGKYTQYLPYLINFKESLFKYNDNTSVVKSNYTTSDRIIANSYYENYPMADLWSLYTSLLKHKMVDKANILYSYIYTSNDFIIIQSFCGNICNMRDHQKIMESIFIKYNFSQDDRNALENIYNNSLGLTPIKSIDKKQKNKLNDLGIKYRIIDDNIWISLVSDLVFGHKSNVSNVKDNYELSSKLIEKNMEYDYTPSININLFTPNKDTKEIGNTIDYNLLLDQLKKKNEDIDKENEELKKKNQKLKNKAQFVYLNNKDYNNLRVKLEKEKNTYDNNRMDRIIFLNIFSNVKFSRILAMINIDNNFTSLQNSLKNSTVKSLHYHVEENQKVTSVPMFDLIFNKNSISIDDIVLNSAVYFSGLVFDLFVSSGLVFDRKNKDNTIDKQIGSLFVANNRRRISKILQGNTEIFLVMINKLYELGYLYRYINKIKNTSLLNTLIDLRKTMLSTIKILYYLYYETSDNIIVKREYDEIGRMLKLCQCSYLFLNDAELYNSDSKWLETLKNNYSFLYRNASNNKNLYNSRFNPA